jgi:hypothetical protein
MNNSHVLTEVKDILVKDFIPKYKTIELIESREIFPFGKPIGLFKFEKVKKRLRRQKNCFCYGF